MMFPRRRRALLLVGAVALVLAVASTAALAKPIQPSPNQPLPKPPIATLKLTPGSGNPGATIKALVTCTQPTVAISIFMFGVPASTPGALPVPNGTGYYVLLFNQSFNPAKPAGATNATFMIPVGLPAGTWEIEGACLYANDFESFGGWLIVPKKVFPPFGWATFFPNLLFQGNAQIQTAFLVATGELAPPLPPPPVTTTTTTKPRTSPTTTPSSTTTTTLPTCIRGQLPPGCKLP